jgi:tRNA dimethylallyltransferase
MKIPALAEKKAKILVITGPTASGKSALAYTICRQTRELNFEIVIADSRQIYSGMDIGTDKPSLLLQKEFPHHLLDIIRPDRVFSAADFRKIAAEAIQGILSRGAIPLVVGGTGLYIRVLLHGLVELPGADSAIREKLHLQLEEEGVGALYLRLQKLDPLRASQIQSNDSFRIIRALEIIEIGSENVSKQLEKHQFRNSDYAYRLFVLNVQREKLYNLIDQRVDKMISRGLINEVIELIKQYGPEAQAFNAIGYNQIIRSLQNRISRQEAIRLIKRDSRRFAKRQITWLRKEIDAIWLDHDPSEPGVCFQSIKKEVAAFFYV